MLRLSSARFRVLPEDSPSRTMLTIDNGEVANWNDRGTIRRSSSRTSLVQQLRAFAVIFTSH